ncbi:MAG: NADH-quinone oxidoreductase subunit NuoE [Sedimentisphaerales bacterium]
MSLTKDVCLNMEPLDTILLSVSQTDSCHLIPILQQIQKAYGYLPAEVLEELSNRSGIEASRIYGVVTFYEQFYLTPHGRHTIRCCRGTACHVKGGKNIIKAIRRLLGIEEGETTEDMEFTFETVACLGACALAPVMVVDGVYYGKMTSRKVNFVLDSVEAGGKETA